MHGLAAAPPGATAACLQANGVTGVSKSTSRVADMMRSHSARCGLGTRHAVVPVLWLPIVLLAGCASPAEWATQKALRHLADGLSEASVSSEPDLVLARDAAPVMLKASEALLQRVPGHLPLAQSVSAGFTQYSYAFVAFEAEQLQLQNPRQAQAMRERAARLYERAQRHAMAALQTRHPRLHEQLSRSGAAVPGGLRLAPDEVGVAYWAAASWAAWISMSKHRPEVVADLPQAVALARLAFAAAPDHGRGALASLVATLEASRPGGSMVQAEAWFAQALRSAGGDDPAVLVAMAESLAQPAGDRPRFEDLLARALRAGAPSADLQTQVMHQRARWLLASADELF